MRIDLMWSGWFGGPKTTRTMIFIKRNPDNIFFKILVRSTQFNLSNPLLRSRDSSNPKESK